MNIAQIMPLADAWGMHGNAGPGWWIAMMVAMVLFWGVIILGGVWLVRGGFDCWPWQGWRSQPPTRSEPRSETPIDVLERRFAEGAISVEDYHNRRAVLVNGADHLNGAQEEEALTAPQAGEGSQ